MASAKLSPNVLKKLESVLDEFMDVVAEDEHSFIGEIGFRKNLVFSSVSELQRYYRTPRLCIYPGCKNKSVAFSHTISKSTFLKFISERQHVLSPVLDFSQMKYIIKSVGINKASAFPGFCEEHENLFSDFEKDGIIKSNHHVYLQVFRTICREIVIKQIQIKSLSNQIEKLREVITNNGIKFINTRLGNEFIEKNKVNLSTLSFKNLSEGLAVAQNSKDELERLLKMLESEFLPNATKEIENKGEFLAHYRIDINEYSPICLSGLGNFSINDNGTHHNVHAVLNILPNPGKTFLSITVSLKHRKYLQDYLALFLNHLNGPLNMMESWMGNGTDHWFIKPSEWEAIPQNRQEKILADIYDESQNIGAHFKRSIIDSIRVKSLMSLDGKDIPENEIQSEKSKYQEDRVAEPGA